MRTSIRVVVASTCLLAAACQPTPSGSENDETSELGEEGHGPNECEMNEDCAPDEVCVQDFSKYCESSCAAREPDLELCGCAEGQYCEPGESCPAIGCAGGQLCSNHACHDVSVAADCADPAWWSLNQTWAEPGSGVVAIRQAQLTLTVMPELLMLRPQSVEMRGGMVWTLPEIEDPTMIRAAKVGETTSELLIASEDEAWLYASVFVLFDDPLPILEHRESFAMPNLVDVQLGDFGGGPELDVWLQSVHESKLFLGNGDSFDEPLSFDQDWWYAPSAAGDLDLDGRDDIATGPEIWLGAEAPAWTAASLTLDSPAWIGSTSVAQPLMIPEGLAIAWPMSVSPDEPGDRYTTIASYLALDSGGEAASADAVLFPGRLDQLIGTAAPVDEGWLGIEGDEIVVYRELAGQHCRAVTQGTGTYVEGELDVTSDRLYLLGANGAVEEWVRL